MKKQYINPTMNIYEVQTQNHILAGSGGVTVDAETGEVQSVGVADGTYSGGEVMSRRSSLWDDED